MSSEKCLEFYVRNWGEKADGFLLSRLSYSALLVLLHRGICSQVGHGDGTGQGLRYSF